MGLYYCPSCSRVYFLPPGSSYLCGRNHAATVWSDGRKRRFVISDMSETNRPPWPVPQMVEERELFRQELSEVWVTECKYPDDTDLNNTRRHFGYNAPGGKHLTRDEVFEKYSDYLLQPAEAESFTSFPAPIQRVEAPIQIVGVKDLIPK